MKLIPADQSGKVLQLDCYPEYLDKEITSTTTLVIDD